MPDRAVLWILVLFLAQCAHCSPQPAPGAASHAALTARSQLSVRKLLRAAASSSTAAVAVSTRDNATLFAQNSAPKALPAPGAKNSSTASPLVPPPPQPSKTAQVPSQPSTAPQVPPQVPPQQAASAHVPSQPPTAPKAPPQSTTSAPAPKVSAPSPDLQAVPSQAAVPPATQKPSKGSTQQSAEAPPTKTRPTPVSSTTPAAPPTATTTTTSSNSNVTSIPSSTPSRSAPAGTSPVNTSSLVAGSNPANSTFRPPATRLVPGPAADAKVASGTSRLPFTPAENERQFEGCVWENDGDKEPKKHGAMMEDFQCCNGAWIKRGCGVPEQPSN